MSKSSFLYVSLTICIIIFILIIELFVFSLKKPYYNKSITINNVDINYPKFNNNMDKLIKKYLTHVNLAKYSKIDYDINIIDSNTSILFKLYKNNKIVDYDSLLFDKNNKKNDLDKIINHDLLLEKIDLYNSNNNLNIPLDKLYKAKISFLLDNSYLKIYLSNYNDNKDITYIKLDYNEFKNNISLKVFLNKNYKVMTSANIPKKYVAFTFDDGPSQYTEEIMNTLDIYKAKCTFFEVGYMISARPEVTLDVYKRGFEIGNHTIDHSKLTRFSADVILSKINDNNALYNSITGSNMLLVRPPYDSINALVKHTIQNPIITWDVDSEDWKSRNAESIVELVKNTIGDGSIVLFHDLYPTTLEAIKILIPYLYQNNYKIVSVSDLFKIYNKPLENGHIYRNAR